MKSYTALRSLPIASVATWSALIAVGTVLASVPASAQEFPSKPLRMVVGFVAGLVSSIAAFMAARITSPVEIFGTPRAFARRSATEVACVAAGIPWPLIDSRSYQKQSKWHTASASPPNRPAASAYATA